MGIPTMIAVRIEKGPTIMLQSGAWFDFRAPKSSNFTIEDIAHGLANICRYAGQCRKFYSVAEHSILVSEVAVGFELEALLHDAAEAFMGDITRPLKQMLPEYKKIEDEVETAISGSLVLGCPCLQKSKMPIFEYWQLSSLRLCQLARMTGSGN
jgi:5'-nucleotidase